MNWLLTGELRPCCWDSTRSWPGIGLYDCGCLPSTLRWQLNCAYFLGFLCHLSPYENTGTSVSELADSYSWCLPLNELCSRQCVKFEAKIWHLCSAPGLQCVTLSLVLTTATVFSLTYFKLLWLSLTPPADQTPPPVLAAEHPDSRTAFILPLDAPNQRSYTTVIKHISWSYNQAISFCSLMAV